MNNFGGNWTKIKIEILIEYAKAYLTIMKNRTFFKLLYFDGFAGSGEIIKTQDDIDTGEVDIDITIGAACRIIEISEPRSFDEYYFVEKKAKNFKELEKRTKKAFPNKKIFTAKDDCNKKLFDLAKFLRNPQNSNYRTLAYIDPCGMQVEWKSIECLKDLPIDLWILVPTGMGVNRLLKTNGKISDAWLKRLEIFLGMSREEIELFFYTKHQSLFPDIINVHKESDAIEKSAKLYKDRLKSVFMHVSQPYELRNASNSVMFHLFLTSNNKAALSIANDIVKKYNK